MDFRSSADIAPTSAETPQNTQLDKQMQDTVQNILNVSSCTAAAAAATTVAVEEKTTKSRAQLSPRRLKEPSLNLSYPSKAGQYELKLLVQPEEQHRARYMTEGSRGAVKDKSQQAHPVVQVQSPTAR